MSHTATCARDEHLDERPCGGALPFADPTPAGPAPFADPTPAGPAGLWQLAALRWTALSVALFLAALALRVAGFGWAADPCFAGCYLAGGWEPGLAGLRALRKHRLDVDLLMVVAALVAAGIGEVLDGGLLIVIFATSGTLEALATRRTRDAVRGLLAAAPEQARRLLPDGTEELVPTRTLGVGDRVVVRPGERVGADGVVVAGASEVDQALITGESMPVAKRVGDDVFAGTLNGDGVLHVEASRPAAATVIARIATLVERASATKARTQLYVEAVEQRYSVAMVCATVLLFVIPLATGAALRPTLLRAMTFMIVASPCAVVLSTMPPLLAAIANAGRHGVLVKSAVAMEQLGDITQVAFDKTGTLTTGLPQVVAVHSCAREVADEDTVLAWAASVERSSEHPLARAVLDAALSRALVVPEAEEFRASPGRAVTALVDGRRITVGRPRPAGASGAGGARMTIQSWERSGLTVMTVHADDRLIGLVGCRDQLRPDAASAVARLTALTCQPPVLLTGDNPRVAALVAGEVGLASTRAGLLPEEKVAALAELRAGGGRLLMVGDGVNDAPALASAYLGVAMGARGADLALETADVVIVREELATLPAAVQLSRHARRVASANLAFAALVVVALVTLDLAGHLPLPLGVAGHEGSTVVVGLNGLRLLRRRHWIT